MSQEKETKGDGYKGELYTGRGGPLKSRPAVDY